MAVAKAVAAEVAERGLVTAVRYHWRNLDTVDEARGLLAHNPARLVLGYRLDSTPPPQWWWHLDQSGGQMVERTTHLLDLARYLLGPVTRAYGMAGHDERAEFPGLDIPTVSSASLQFASGAIGNFASTRLLSWNHRVGLHLFGRGLAIEPTDRHVMIDTGHGRPVRGDGGDPVWREDRDFIDAVRGLENRIRCPYPESVETLWLSLGAASRRVMVNPSPSPRSMCGSRLLSEWRHIRSPAFSQVMTRGRQATARSGQTRSTPGCPRGPS